MEGDSSVLEPPVPRKYYISPELKDIKSIEEIKRAQSNYRNVKASPQRVGEPILYKRGRAPEQYGKSPYLDLRNNMRDRRKMEEKEKNKYPKLPRILLSEKRREKLVRDYSMYQNYHEREKSRGQRDYSLNQRDHRQYIYMKPEWWG